jgi:ATP-binding cassette subfamily B protein
VGPTGSGKTTIINLMNRFYDVNSGSIEIDQKDLYSYQKNTIRKRIGVVLQDTILFSGTVYDNIIYGDLSSNKEEVIKAAKLANAHDFIMKLPHGYDSEVYEGGQNFSQGERQLISIARTILSNPDILILDEATSNVDTRTEFKIQESMKLLMNGRTSIVIAHRLQTIRNANKIIVISDGELIESGSHIELLDAKGFYHDLYTTQFKDLLQDLKG